MSTKEIVDLANNVLTYPLFTIHQTPITITSLFLFVIIIVFFMILSKLLKNKLLKLILKKLHVEEGIQFTLVRITQYIITFVGMIVAFQFIGIDLSGLAVILGFLSVGIGFGLQNITSNFIAGVILLFERPISVGDRVTVGTTQGDVININIRSTTIKSLNNIAYIVPNSDFISTTVVNWSHGDKKIRLDLDVGVSYNSDLDTVLKALMEVGLENKEVLKNPRPEVHMLAFGDSSWNMRLRVWIPDPKRYYYIQSDLNCAVVRKFRDNNIEIPFPQRDLHIRSSEAIEIKPSD
jgi:small-conductance mechanosensitive channel